MCELNTGTRGEKLYEKGGKERKGNKEGKKRRIIS